MQSLLSKQYADIPDRSIELDTVRKELNLVINALPTQVHPDEREGYLVILLDDLEDREGAPWTIWPENVYLLALTAVKTLGRNPVGSETLLSRPHLETLVHHTSLPFPPSPSPFSHPPSLPAAPPALEALKVIANLLVLHSGARDRFAEAGGAKAIARALAGRDGSGNYVDDDCEQAGTAAGVERLFLLGRIGFLVTLDRKTAAEAMVDKEDILESLAYHLTTTIPMPANLMALTELFKLANNVVRFYPHTGEARTSSSSQSPDEPWDSRFDILLPPALNLLYAIPFSDLAPPLSTTLHLLLAVPFIPSLLPTWHSVTVPDPPDPNTGNSFRALLNRLSSISAGASNVRSSLTETWPGSRRSKSPSPPDSMTGKKRSCTVFPRKEDDTAFLLRVLSVLDGFLDRYLPWPKAPDDELERGLMLDETLPPVLLLLARAVAGSRPMRVYLRSTLLPQDLDRSPEAGPLEKRNTLLGSIIRLMNSSSHHSCKGTAGELMWAVCGSDASILSAEIGYGNAAGVLFRKGISNPPPACIQDLESTPNTHDLDTGSDLRDPITALQAESNNDNMADMTQEEKEAEAERLFMLFDKLEKNPVISAQSGGRGVTEVLKEKYVEVDEGWSERERQEAEEEDRHDEAEALREIEQYRKRAGKR